MMPLYIALAVALICFVLYALDRRLRSEPIDWFSASKLTVLGGLLSGGIAYSVDAPQVAEAVKAVVQEAPVTQEMFVGQPTF
jgi:hypothetical protein